MPLPKAPGATETLTVDGLSPDTTYYFAIKVSDDAIPANTSEVSNCAAGVPSAVGSMVLQNGVNGYAGTKDSYYIYNSGTNYAGQERMVVCGYGLTAAQRPIIKFDLSSLAGINVTSATLSLYSYYPDNTKGSTGYYGLYHVTTDWIDNQVNWTAAGGGVNWTTPGGDFLPDADAQAPKQSASALPAWYTWDVTDCVRGWLNGQSPNYGWIVKCINDGDRNQDYFYQSNTGNASLRPKLVISDLQPRKTGDANDDGLVNVGDLLSLVSSWGKSANNRGYEPWTDFNGDGYINVGDLQILITNWNQ